MGKTVVLINVALHVGLRLGQPVLFNSDLEKLKHLPAHGFDYSILRSVFLADGKPGRLEESINRICCEAEKAIRSGKKIIVISDKKISPEYAPIPSLLAIGAVHHYLILPPSSDMAPAPLILIWRLKPFMR